MSVLDVRAVSCCSAENDNAENLVHCGFKFGIDPRFVNNGIIAQVDALGRILINASYEILINFLGHERNHGGGSLAYSNERGVKHHVCVYLVLRKSLYPITLSAAADIPVRHLVDKCIESLCRFGNTVVVKVIIDCFNGGIKARKEPLVHYIKLVVIYRVLCGVEVIYIRIENIESIGIPKSTHELALTLLNGFSVEAVRKPRSGVGVEIPADSVRAVLLECVERVNGVALRFRHFLSVFILNMAENDNILKAGLIEQKR